MKYIISILIISLLASCKTGKNARANEKNTIYKKWELNTLNGQTIHEEIPIYLDLKEEDHAVNGFIGCNSVNGSFTIEEKEIRFTQLATTRKACMDMSLESKVLNLMNTAESFSFVNGKLILHVDGKEVASFYEMDKTEMTNTYWKLIELDGKSIKMTKNQEREQFVIFTKEGTVSGFSGCNHFNGFYQLTEGYRIAVDDKISITYKDCPDEGIDERTFLNAMIHGNNFKIQNGKMKLYGKDKVELAVFEAIHF